MKQIVALKLKQYAFKREDIIRIKILNELRNML